MLRALQQVSQAVGEAGNVSPDKAGHRVSQTENMEHPYSCGIGPEFIGNSDDNLPPKNDLSQGVAESFPPVNDFNWYTCIANCGYDQFNRGPRLAGPENGGIGGNDRSDHLWPLIIYLLLAIATSGNKKSQISLKEIKWNGMTLSHTLTWSQGGITKLTRKRDLSLLHARLRKSSVVFRSHKEVTMRQ